jgi:streptogramin lyase
MKAIAPLFALAVAGPLAVAQDSYWIANRNSSDLMRVAAWGSVLQRVTTPTTLRSCHTAPDGKVWVVRFIQPVFDIYDPATAAWTSVALPSGNAYQIAFDAAGHAWITNSAAAVHEYDANGVLLGTYGLSAGSALGIAIDAGGNKWIAHRASPASVSRIDGLTGAVTNHLIGSAGGMLPTAVIADFRGIAMPSRIWVVGDSSGNLAEFDASGTWLNTYPLGVSNIGSLAFSIDAAVLSTSSIWVGSFGTGTLLQVNPGTGAILSSWVFGPSINGLAMDHYGRLLATARVTFSGVGPPCELRRIDPASGALQIPAKLEFGGFSAVGTQAAASTQWQYGLVVNPVGDLDGDGEANISEILNGTSPIDPNSTSWFRVESFGVTMNGGVPTFGVQAAPVLWVVGYAGALLPAPTPVPGFGGLLAIDPSTLGSTTAGVGSASLPFPIPANPALINVEVFAQGATFNGAGFDFENVTGLKVW